MYRYEMTIEEIKQKTHEVCEFFNGRSYAVRHKYPTRPGIIAAIIGKSIQTVKQYRASLDTSASRIMPADDMLKLYIERDFRVTNRHQASVERQRNEILTGVSALPSYVKKPAGYKPSCYEVFSADGQLIGASASAGRATQIADVRGGYIRRVGEGPIELDADASLRHRYRQLMLSARVTIEDACKVFDCCAYTLIAFWLEDASERRTPKPALLEKLERMACAEEAA